MKVILLLNNNLNFLFLKKNDYKYIIVYNKITNVYIKYKFDLLQQVWWSVPQTASEAVKLQI